jgi:CheY-like chemotaxis protein
MLTRSINFDAGTNADQSIGDLCRDALLAAWFSGRWRFAKLPPSAPVRGGSGLLPSLIVLPSPQSDSIPSDTYLMHTFVLADDHGVVRQSLKKLLTQEADLHLVGEAGDGLEVLKLVEELEPDVLVTDLMMPGLNGLEVIRRVRQSSPETRIIAVSVNSDDPYVEGAFTCGADAYVLKASCGKHLVPAVRAALGGERYISPPLAGSTF